MLAKSPPRRSLARRDAVLSIIASWEPSQSIFQDIVALNRAAAGLHSIASLTIIRSVNVL
jgi:hypothetical protein